MDFEPCSIDLPTRDSYNFFEDGKATPSPSLVCRLSPCMTDGPCRLTGGRCRRPWPWRRTAEALMDAVISHTDMDAAIANPLTPDQKQKAAPSSRRVPFTPNIPGI
jgi:hypothetical protein